PQKSAKKANKKELVGEDGLAAKTWRRRLGGGGRRKKRKRKARMGARPWTDEAPSAWRGAALPGGSSMGF
ncbi:MAG: hypothetical protein WAM44_19005, partial [Chthoniobacterales bacterium]